MLPHIILVNMAVKQTLYVKYGLNAKTLAKRVHL